MSLGRWWWLIGAVALAGGGLLLRSGIAPAAPTYVLASVERGDVESAVVAAGILQPVTYVDVGAQTSGKLKSLKVARGDQVVADQLLAEIDPLLTETILAAATATLANITAQHAMKQAQWGLAEAQETRFSELFDAQQISASDRDIAVAAVAVAAADVDALAAQMRQAAAAVATATANVAYTKITAPRAGEVVVISLLEGQTLNANQQAPNILRIADLGTMTVWAQVSEADIFPVKPGQAVHFTVLGRTREWTSKVRQILPTPELINNVVFYDVLFDVANPERELRIQQTAQVFIVLAQAKAVLNIPVATIGTAATGATVTVQVLDAAGHPAPRQITVGIRSETAVEVRSGLTEHEQIVLREIAPPGAGRSALTGRR